jgi:hypothetical protein
MLEALWHAYVVEIRGRKPDKTSSVLKRLIFAVVVLWFLDQDKMLNFYPTIPAYFFISWWVHNYMFNVFRNLYKYVDSLYPKYFKIWYLNKDSFPDRYLKEYEHIVFVLLTITSFTLLAIYLNAEKIAPYL